MNNNNAIGSLQKTNLGSNIPSGQRTTTTVGMKKYLKYSLYVIGIVVLVYLFVRVYRSASNASASAPMLVDGTKDAATPVVVPAKKIKQSVDGRYGVEFSYSFWMNVSRWDNTQFKHIFHKGTLGASTPPPEPSQITSQAPGVWLDKNKNNLRICMNVFPSTDKMIVTDANNYLECFQVTDIPMKKWVLVNIVVINRFVDVYINGNLKRRHKLRSIPVQNYGDVFVNHYNGFPGLISNLQYFNYALPIWKIEQEMNSGPSSIPVADQPSGDYNYLAPDYWLQGN